MPIRILEDQLINQIAAGEVVERPAAVVKEAVENSVDAGASHITVELEQGGMSLIRVRDDGAGIAPGELALALARHATSKIARLDHLEAVETLGFRGEALPSMLSVSRLRLVSRAAGEPHGWCVTGEGALLRQDPVPAAHPFGTTLEVRDLFYNTPARRKFLKTEATEFRHADQWLRRIALARTDIGLSWQHNGRRILDLPPVPDERGRDLRIASVCGEGFVADSASLDESRLGMRFRGLIGLPSAARSLPDLQYFYVNGRCVRDRLLASAIRRAYADALHSTRYPAFVLYLEIDPRLVDVNVHPQKTEVRFRESTRVHDLLFGTIHRALRALRPDPSRHHRVELAARGYGTPPVQAPLAYAYAPTAVPARASEGSPQASLQVTGWPLLQPRAAEPGPARGAGEGPLGHAIAQLHGVYILAQNAAGLVLVDAHAAHERVLYERFKQQLAAGEVASQALLVPVSLNLDEEFADALEREARDWQRLGLELDRSGPRTVTVRRVPALIGREDVEALVRGLIEREPDALGNHFGEVLDAQQRVMAGIACRAAIKAHRRLMLPEMDALLRDMEQTALANQCNHGRRTWVQLDLPSLDRLFLRGR